MATNQQDNSAGVSEPHGQCGCGENAEEKALHEVAEAKAEVSAAENEMEKAIRDERSAGQSLEKAEAELEAARHHEIIHFEVDGEPHETKQRVWTPNAIIKDFGEQDPATNYLVRLGGHEPHSYRDKGTIPIDIHDCERFQIIPVGPAPVSDGTKRSGIEVFIAGLKDLAFEPVPLKGISDRIFFDYEVPTGKYAGRQFRLGLIVPQDFPLSAPAGIHVSPRIHANRGGQVHPADGIQDSPDFQKGAGGEWHYWSRPCNEWGKTKKTVAAYMNHVFRLWDTQ
jgi:Prokaryotic E2 family E